MNLRVVGSALIALACSQPYSATAQSKLDPEVLAEFGGTYSTDCAGRVATRLRVESQSLVVERGTPLLSGSNVSTSYSYFGRSSPKGFLVALKSIVPTNHELNFLIFREGDVQWAMVAGAPSVEATLGPGVSTQKFHLCPKTGAANLTSGVPKGSAPTSAAMRTDTTRKAGPGNAIEFASLIKMFLVNSKEGPFMALGWNDPAFKHPAIKWATPNVVELPYKRDMPYMYERKGSVFVTVNGKPAVEIGGKPAPMEIIAGGARTMFGDLTIQPSIGYDDRSSERGGIDVTKDLGGKFYRCKPEFASEGVTIEQLNISGKNPAWLLSRWSCGSKGCGYSYTLWSSKQSADQYTC